MNDQSLLYTHPLECLTFGGSLIISRGANRFVVEGQQGVAFLRLIIALADTGIRMSELLEEFAQPDHGYVEQLVQALVNRRFARFSDERDAPDPGESPEDLFFWHFEADQDRYRTLRQTSPIVLVGLNLLSLNMRDALLRNGFEDVRFIDDPFVRDSALHGSPALEPLQAEIHSTESLVEMPQGSTQAKPLVVICSDRGPTPAFSTWNAWCLQRGWPLLPVVFGNFRCAIGPLVMDATTPCLECLSARENSNLNNPQLEQAWINRPSEGRMADRAYLDAMLLSVAGMATFEIIKLLTGLTPPPVAEVIDYALLETSVRRHPVLKIPRCPACSSTVERPTLNISRDEFRKKLMANGR